MARPKLVNLVMTDFSRNLSEEEYNSYLEENRNLLQKLPEFSALDDVYYYNLRDNNIIHFDFKKAGKLYSYTEFKAICERKNINLRILLSEYWGGVRYSRQNYLDNKDLIDDLDNNVSFFLMQVQKKFGIDPNKLDDSIISYLNRRLNAMSEKELVEVEVPIAVMFYNYARNTYHCPLQLLSITNQFKESYSSIAVKDKYGYILSISDLVFISLFPDPDRDDIENEEDICVKLEKVKGQIDFWNSDRAFKFEH